MLPAAIIFGFNFPAVVLLFTGGTNTHSSSGYSSIVGRAYAANTLGAIAGAITLLTGDQSTALAAALTARLYNYINSGVIGGIGLMREGQTLSGIYHQLKNFRAGKSAEQASD